MQGKLIRFTLYDKGKSSDIFFLYRLESRTLFRLHTEVTSSNMFYFFDTRKFNDGNE